MMSRLQDMWLGLQDLLKFDHVAHLLSQRLLGRGTGWTVYRKDKLCFLVDHSAGDQNGTRDCLTQPMYRDLLKLLKLPKSLRLLDLGSNGGGFPLLCLDEGHNITALACVEVNPWTFSRLSLNITHNVGLHAKLLNVAIGSHERLLRLRLTHGGTGHSIYEGATSGDEVEIRVRSFDDIYTEAFGDGFVDVCKMDVEGAEYETLLEGHAESLRKVHHLIIEIHTAPAEKQQALRTRLQALGLKHVMTSQAHDDVHLFTNETWAAGGSV